MLKNIDVLIIGAGAAGLICAITAAKRGRKVLVIDHANKAGKKILMSGGGRCNFTNYFIEYEKYISKNKHFFKSALARYTQWDFISMVEEHDIPYHEKTLGQLFCDNKSKDILNMLLDECKTLSVELFLKTTVNKIKNNDNEKVFDIETTLGNIQCQSLVIATGALSIPSMGATGFGYEVARQFDLKVTETKAGLVPFIMPERWLQQFGDLAGASLSVNVICNKQEFRENILFTHKGLSGPAVLQASSYWSKGDFIEIDLLPEKNAEHWLKQMKIEKGDTSLSNILSLVLTKKFASKIADLWFQNLPMKQLPDTDILFIADKLNHWKVWPEKTEGYKTAEVTVGGVDTNAISSKTMEVKSVPGLFFIGEVLDVTGHLGGFNFQWAWASGFVCGEVA